MRPKLIVLVVSLAAVAAWVGKLASFRSWPDGF
jgi:hypothetical protein